MIRSFLKLKPFFNIRLFSANPRIDDAVINKGEYGKLAKGIYKLLKPNADEYHKIETTIIELSNEPEKLQDYMEKTRRRMIELESQMGNYRKFTELVQRIEDNKDLLKQAENDEEMTNLINEENEKFMEDFKRLEKELSFEVLPIHKYDIANCTVELRQAVGGKESALFAEWLSEVYENFCNRMRFNWQNIKLVNDAGGKGIKNSTFKVEGFNAYKWFKYESGVHKYFSYNIKNRVQRVPETEKKGRVHSSTALVIVMPEIPMDFKLDKREVRMERFRSSGPGGQHANRTESAIRLTHLPTGLQASIQDERTQESNIAKAWELLTLRVYMRELEAYINKTADQKKSQVKTGDLNERIRTYNWPDDRVTDHRLGKTVKGLGKIVDGKVLEDFIEKLMDIDNNRQIENLLNE